MRKGLSLHVGMQYCDSDHYGEMATLETCQKDALDMQDIADARGFESQLLLNEAATTDAIKSAITHASKQLQEGDMFFFSYSGHGGSLPDTNHDEGENDHADETLCLYDRQLLDDELALLWGAFKEGVRIVVVSDSCHSGTVIKAPQEEHDNEPTFLVKSIDGAKAREVYRKNQETYDAVSAEIDPIKEEDIHASVLLLAACQDYQFSYILQQAENSLFTEKLNQVWDGSQFVGTIASFFEQVKAKVEAVEIIDQDGTVLKQTPNLYTVGKELEGYVEQKPFAIFE